MLRAGHPGAPLVAMAVAAGAANAAWRVYLHSRQLRATQKRYADLEPVLQPLTTEADFDKAQRYTAAKTEFAIVRTAIAAVADAAVAATGLMGKVWGRVPLVLPGIETGSFAHSCAWGAAFDLFESAIALPLDVYSTFVVEERYGFNKTTPGTFVFDRVKMVLLKTLVMRPITTGLIRFVVDRFGPRFPLFLCGGVSAVAIAASFLVPTLIMPLFNKFEPLPAGDTRDRIEGLAKKTGFPLTKLYVMDGSKRSAHSNAFMYGFWRNKRIVLFDVLLDQMTPLEIEAVLAHELGHWDHSHMLYNMGFMVASIFAYGQASALVLFDAAIYEAFGMPPGAKDPVVGFELFGSVYYQPLAEALEVGHALLSRRFEFQADAFAASLGYAEPLRSGLVKMFKENAATLTPDSVYAACRYSHPPLRERLAALGGAKAKEE